MSRNELLKEKAIELFAGGERHVEIARQIKKSTTYVTNILKKAREDNDPRLVDPIPPTRTGTVGGRKQTSNYTLSKELGIDVCFYRMSPNENNPNSIITLARVPTMEKPFIELKKR
jgi:hypothetical protein